MRLLLANALVAVCLTAMPGSAQDAPELANGDPDTPSLRIEERPAVRESDTDAIDEKPTIFVQLNGVWAPSEEDCPDGEAGRGDDGTLLVTDTMIRFQNATCSIRDMETQTSDTTVKTRCATSDGYERRQMTLIRQSSDRLTLVYPENGDQQHRAELLRCK